MDNAQGGTIRVGIGGWTYAPWRGTFYPEGHQQKRELEYASRPNPAAATSLQDFIDARRQRTSPPHRRE